MQRKFSYTDLQYSSKDVFIKALVKKNHFLIFKTL